ncbi:MAG: hypothetical protein ACYDIA_11275 [Candidatus Humimicrobiaceae bacterium]
MSINLIEEIMKNFLELMEKDENIGKSLGESICKSISLGTSTKEDILNLLETEINKNENPKIRD